MGRKSITGVLGGLSIGIVLCVSMIQNSSADGEFTGSFSTSLTVSGVVASVLKTDVAGISWVTSDNASSQVFYDITTHEDVAEYAFHSNLDSTPVLQHTVTLAGLQGSTVYHLRAMSTASVRGAQFTAISQDLAFETAASSGTGGSGGNHQVVLSHIVSSTPLTLNSAGVTLTPSLLTTGDGQASLKVAAGTGMLDSHGQPLRSLSLAVPGGVLPPSSDSIISAVDFDPEGATFVPPMTLTLGYSSQTLANGISEGTLYIAFWDGSGWQRLMSTVDTLAGTVSAPCSQSGLFAIMGEKQAGTPTPTLQPSPMPPSLPAASLPSIPSPPIGPAGNWSLYLWLSAAVLSAVTALLLWRSRPYGWRQG